ncbi:hypothetical protein E9840_04935 [Tissierella creatinini]|nr:hypothetical protein E9840_04935 [Tissierella creatinini]TJX67186.1 hypothetical protein E8P77_06165 [Soehngenia saccharolytica]
MRRGRSKKYWYPKKHWNAKRRVSKNSEKGDSYLILILACLLVLNLGALAIRYASNHSFIKNVFGQGRERLAMDEPAIEDEDEMKTEEDYIIDRLDEYESLIIIKENTGISSIENIPKPLNINKLSLNKEESYILMYHTHGTESFLIEDPWLYHNQDINKNVVNIGDVMTKVLEAKGHKVDHVKNLHDLPSYNQSYTRSSNTVKTKKESNSNLKILLDVHRDGVAQDAKYKDRFLKTARTEINGVSTATFSLVIGPDTPNYDEVLSFAKYIKAVSDTLYPNLCTGIIIKPAGKYNLYFSDYAALLEIGSNLVTQEEATETAKRVGEILSLVLDSIIE